MGPEDYGDLSVVIQGPVTDLRATFHTIQSVRRHLPGSEIVLSTWAPAQRDKSFAERIELLAVDHLVLSQDPGAWLHNPSGVRSNLHRMLLSTKNGLEAATNESVLKLRTDTELVGTGFLNGASHFDQRIPESSILEAKVTVPSAFTRSSFPRPARRAARRIPAILHVSDWAAYGLRSDLLQLYGITPPIEPAYSTFMVPLWRELPEDVPFRYEANFQFPPEMFIGLKAVGEKLGIKMQHYLDEPERWERAGQAALVSNFVVLNTFEDFGISNFKYPKTSRTPWRTLDAAETIITTHKYSRLYSEFFSNTRSKPRPGSEMLGDIHAAAKPLYRAFPSRFRRSRRLRKIVLGDFA